MTLLKYGPNFYITNRSKKAEIYRIGPFWRRNWSFEGEKSIFGTLAGQKWVSRMILSWITLNWCRTRTTTRSKRAQIGHFDSIRIILGQKIVFTPPNSSKRPKSAKNVKIMWSNFFLRQSVQFLWLGEVCHCFRVNIPFLAKMDGQNWIRSIFTHFGGIFITRSW